jgi:dienelactone hydrolase
VRNLLLSLFLPLFFLPAAFSAVQVKEADYAAGGVKMKGALAWDGALKTPRPGVLVVHEWWGLNDYARQRARMLAELGYVALAVDMYGGGKTAEHPKDAGAFASAVMGDPQGAIARFQAALDFLKSQPQVDPRKTAAIGYCFGGATVLNMARAGLDLDAVASFHGSLAGNVEAKKPIRAKILVCHGAADSFTTAEQIEAFKKEMKEAGADMEFIPFPGAKHGFTNPESDAAAKRFGLDIAYQKEADELSWEALQGLLLNVFSRK